MADRDTLYEQDHFFFCSNNPHGPTPGTGTENRADIPQNTPDLGQSGGAVLL